MERASSSKASQIRILLVADFETQHLMAHCLRDCEILFAKDYHQALNIMLSRVTEIVISEEDLPKIGGVGVLSAASSLQPQAKRVLLGVAPDNLNELIAQGIVHLHIPDPRMTSTSSIDLLGSLIRAKQRRVKKDTNEGFIINE